MTAWSASRYEEIQGRVRGLLIEVAPQLPAITAGLIDEMIDANECGVALETMSEMLVESEGVISAETLTEFSSLVQEMGLDQINVERLRHHVGT
ncbi:MAG: hypothetical protein ABSB68_11010 [Acidimicrobiales bacterium]|jgi:hypothetical protein